MYSLILITVCNIVKLPAGKKQAVALHLSSVQNDIFNLRALKNDYLLVCSREYSDIESEAVFIENSFNDISKEVLVKINEITPYSNLRKDSSWVSELSKLTANILLFSDHSARLFDTFREMGNSGSGLISQWIKTSDLLAANTDQNNRGLSGRLAEIKRLESSYLLNFDPRNTSEIISICDDMSSLFKDNDSELYGPLLSEYVSLTVKIHETGNRIYNNGDNSLLKEADRDYEAGCWQFNRPHFT